MEIEDRDVLVREIADAVIANYSEVHLTPTQIRDLVRPQNRENFGPTLRDHIICVRGWDSEERQDDMDQHQIAPLVAERMFDILNKKLSSTAAA